MSRALAPHLAAQWERCRGWLTPALGLLEATEAELIEQLASGRAQLWPGEASAHVTALVAGEERALFSLLAGGDLRELLELAPGIEAWGRAQGAEVAVIYGRPGWARVLAARGYAVAGDGLRKDL